MPVIHGIKFSSELSQTYNIWPRTQIRTLNVTGASATCLVFLRKLFVLSSHGSKAFSRKPIDAMRMCIYGAIGIPPKLRLKPLNLDVKPHSFQVPTLILNFPATVEEARVVKDHHLAFAKLDSFSLTIRIN